MRHQGITKRILEVLSGGGVFTTHELYRMIPEYKGTENAFTANLHGMYKRGHIVKIKRGCPGCRGILALWKVEKGAMTWKI